MYSHSSRFAARNPTVVPSQAGEPEPIRVCVYMYVCMQKKACGNMHTCHMHSTCLNFSQQTGTRTETHRPQNINICRQTGDKQRQTDTEHCRRCLRGRGNGQADRSTGTNRLTTLCLCGKANTDRQTHIDRQTGRLTAAGACVGEEASLMNLSTVYVCMYVCMYAHHMHVYRCLYSTVCMKT